MNVQKAPWNDIHVRRAVAYALNRPTSSPPSATTPSRSRRSSRPPSSTASGRQEQVSALINALPSYPYNLATAKQELAESAYPHGFTATTQTITFASYTPVNEAVAADLAKIGINLKLKTIGFTQYLAFASGDKIAIGGLYATMNVTNADADSFPSALLGSVNIADGGYDWADYDPPVIDTLIRRARQPRTRSSGSPSTGRCSRRWRPTCPTCRSTSRTTTSRWQAITPGPDTTFTPRRAHGN